MTVQLYKGPDDSSSLCPLASLKVYKDGTNSAHSKHKSDYEVRIAQDVCQPSASAFEIRFIQSTGWCVKHLSKGSSKAVYHMLFLDGTSVTIDGVQVEFTAQAGNILRSDSI